MLGPVNIVKLQENPLEVALAPSTTSLGQKNCCACNTLAGPFRELLEKHFLDFSNMSAFFCPEIPSSGPTMKNQARFMVHGTVMVASL